jgi:hypothetical protein
MVCSKCEKLLQTKAEPKMPSNMVLKGTHNDRKIGINMLLEKKKFGFNPLASNCLKCKKRLAGDDKYCNMCAYTEGKCKMCGVKILCTMTYRQSVY